jgi:hypothetical protein
MNWLLKEAVFLLTAGAGGWVFGHLVYLAYQSRRTDQWRRSPREGDECFFKTPYGARRYGRITRLFPRNNIAVVEYAHLTPGGFVRFTGAYSINRLYPAGKRGETRVQTERNSFQRTRAAGSP